MSKSASVMNLHLKREENMTRNNEIGESMQFHRFSNMASYVILLVVCVVLFAPLISNLSLIGGDYIAHLKWASDMESRGEFLLPHPLYHLLVIFVKKYFPLTS